MDENECEKLMSAIESWIGFKDTNDSGFYHNMRAIWVFWLMYDHAHPWEGNDGDV